MKRSTLSILVLFVVPALAATTTFAQAEGDQATAALERFIEAWNSGDNAQLRTAMNFPFLTFFAGRLQVAEQPQDFAEDFSGMRERNDWVRSAFDFGSLEIFESSEEKVHCAIDFRRYNSQGEAYMHGRVMYIVTRQDGRWALQMRTAGVSTDDAEVRARAIAGARGAVLDFFTGFNAADAEATARSLHHPHVFMTPGGGFSVASEASESTDNSLFQRLRESQNWHMSTIDSLEPSIVAPNKVHMEITFSRWHPDGTRYLTIPALWIVTRSGSDHWGVQLRSLMPPTFSDLGN